MTALKSFSESHFKYKKSDLKGGKQNLSLWLFGSSGFPSFLCKNESQANQMFKLFFSPIFQSKLRKKFIRTYNDQVDVICHSSSKSKENNIDVYPIIDISN